MSLLEVNHHLNKNLENSISSSRENKDLRIPNQTLMRMLFIGGLGIALSLAPSITAAPAEAAKPAYGPRYTSEGIQQIQREQGFYIVGGVAHPIGTDDTPYELRAPYGEEYTPDSLKEKQREQGFYIKDGKAHPIGTKDTPYELRAPYGEEYSTEEPTTSNQ